MDLSSSRRRMCVDVYLNGLFNVGLSARIIAELIPAAVDIATIAKADAISCNRDSSAAKICTSNFDGIIFYVGP